MSHHSKSAERYEIRIKGHLAPDYWAQVLEGLTVTYEADETILSGLIVDQAALFGLLNCIRDLGLTLVLVQRLPSEYSIKKGEFKMNKHWYADLLWVIVAAALGFATAALFAGVFQLPRNVFLIPYAIVSGGIVYGFFRWSRIDLAKEIRRNWLWALPVTIFLGVFVVNNILSQPASAPSEGLTLVFDVLWIGVVYGALDALLLSILPVLAVWQAFSKLGWTSSWVGKILVGVFALGASLFVTAAYHLGYPEYRGPQVGAPLFGNGMMSLGYLVTANPATAVLSHIAMHIAGVLHGPATTMQLPPHY